MKKSQVSHFVQTAGKEHWICSGQLWYATPKMDRIHYEMNHHNFRFRTRLANPWPSASAGRKKSAFSVCSIVFGAAPFDGLLDTLDSRGGTFYVLTEEDPAIPEPSKG